MPPPVIWGARIEPWRARPVPFCLNGLRPAPLTSARVFVLCVPWRAAASWATTTWCSRGMLVCASKISAGRSTFTVLAAIWLCSLHGGAYEDDLAAGAGDGTLDQQQRLLCVDSVNLEVQRGLTNGAHAACHFHSTEDAAGGGCSTDGTGLAVVLVSTVRGSNTVETVALHDTGKTLALGGADDVDRLAGFEHLHGEFLTERVGVGVGRPQL